MSQQHAHSHSGFKTKTNKKWKKGPASYLVEPTYESLMGLGQHRVAFLVGHEQLGGDNDGLDRLRHPPLNRLF